jgi:hypothetical protein
MTTDADGRFTEAAMTVVMREIAERIGAAHHDAHLLRLTNNAVFALPTAGLVIRITRSHELHARVRKVTRLGVWFAETDAPTIRLATGFEQPVRVDHVLGTIWTYVPSTPPTPTVADLGAVLREFHRLGQPSFALPEWDPVGDARSRLVDAEGLRDADRDQLLAWCDRLAPRVAALNERAGPGLVHGDAHLGNLLRDPAGRVLLCDFDPTCLGPWQVDLAAVPVGEARFGRAGAQTALIKAYGYDVTTDPDWPLLREARELKMVVAAVPLLASAPGVAQEFEVRLRSVHSRDDETRWTPFADLRPSASGEAHAR